MRVRASSANPWDWHFIRGEPVAMRAGWSVASASRSSLSPAETWLGRSSRSEEGDRVRTRRRVYGFGHGAFAEYVAVPQGSLARKPVNLTFEQAAAVPLAAVTAIQGLRAGKLRAGQHVLVIGASGGVGTFAVQIAKHLGAQITGVCSTANVELVRQLGADHVIDYTTQDIFTGPTRYDLVLQLGGTYSPAAIRRVLTPAARSFSPTGTATAGSDPSATSSRPQYSAHSSARP